MKKKDLIDFVVLWVDGSDINWLKEKQIYDKSIEDAASCASRFRDWDNMQYWFRGIEKYTPWVHRVFFVTWGHTPSWLKTDHPKLRIVNHREFIPEEYLPTFNSNTIELNLHRIPDLSEHFVLFNDDMFMIRKTAPEDFFRNGIPCDEFVMNAIVPHSNMPIIGHTSVNNVGIINKYFSKRQVTKQMFRKIYNTKYGIGMLRNALLSSWGEFTGFYNTHIPQAHLKSTFELLWEKEYEKLHATCLNRFREYNDLNHWLMRYWNMCSGNFVPRASSFGKLFNVSDDNRRITAYITGQKGKTLCINDVSTAFDFEHAKQEINTAFAQILPEKSSFELG